MSNSWRRLCNGLLDMMYPRLCGGCGGRVEGESGHLCWNCLSGMPLIQLPFCARCGDPVPGRVDQAYVCYACSAAEPWFDQARSAVRYRGVAREMLRAFKYGAALWLMPDLAHLLDVCVRKQLEGLEVDLVTCVPLYPARERHRGFNQARLLAGALARKMGKPFVHRLLRRIRPTATQTHLTALQRAANVKGAFIARHPGWIEGQRVLLVDDVMTTGATVNECARALKEGAAARVYVATLARG